MQLNAKQDFVNPLGPAPKMLSSVLYTIAPSRGYLSFKTLKNRFFK